MNEAWALGVLGATALAQAQGPRAAELLGQMTAHSRAQESRPMLGVGLAYAAHVARHLGQADMARQSLAEALRLGLDIRSLLPLWVALPAAALLLADRGQAEQAVGIYALASRYPYVANSRWYADIAGQRIAEVAATLPPEVVAAAQARGRARDIWSTAKELLEELERCPSPGR